MIMPEFVEIRTEPEEAKPELDVPFELLDLDLLKPHEELDPNELEAFIESVTSSSIFWKAALISKEGYVILDGHHRWAGLKKLNAKVMPCILLDYVNNPEVKVYTWYPFIVGSLNHLIDVLKNIEEIEIIYESNKDTIVEKVENMEAAFGLIHSDASKDFILIVGDGDPYDLQKIIIKHLIDDQRIQLGYIDTIKGAEELLAQRKAVAYFVRRAPRKREIVERASKGKVYPPKTTRHSLPFVPKKIHVPLDKLLNP